MRHGLTLRIAVLAVLMSAATASSVAAECAWVLWTTRYTMQGGRTTGEVVLPLDGHALKRECDKSLERREKNEAERRQKDPSRTDYFVCLPDTVDPRGPKVRY
jgi:hypothetical protein